MHPAWWPNVHHEYKRCLYSPLIIKSNSYVFLRFYPTNSSYLPENILFFLLIPKRYKIVSLCDRWFNNPTPLDSLKLMRKPMARPLRHCARAGLRMWVLLWFTKLKIDINKHLSSTRSWMSWWLSVRALACLHGWQGFDSLPDYQFNIHGALNCSRHHD